MNTQWQHETIVYINGYDPQVTRIFLFIFLNLIIRERAYRELNDSLGERVNLEGQPHYFREELSVMNLRTFQHNYVIDFW